MGLIPGLGRSSGLENSNLLQYFCLENSMDREAWWATVHWAVESWTQLSTKCTQCSLLYKQAKFIIILMIISLFNEVKFR